MQCTCKKNIYECGAGREMNVPMYTLRIFTNQTLYQKGDWLLKKKSAMTSELEKCKVLRTESCSKFSRLNTKILHMIKRKLTMKKIQVLFDELIGLHEQCLTTNEKLEQLSLQANDAGDEQWAITKEFKNWEKKYTDLYKETHKKVEHYRPIAENKLKRRKECDRLKKEEIKAKKANKNSIEDQAQQPVENQVENQNQLQQDRQLSGTKRQEGKRNNAEEQTPQLGSSTSETQIYPLVDYHFSPTGITLKFRTPVNLIG